MLLFNMIMAIFLLLFLYFAASFIAPYLRPNPFAKLSYQDRIGVLKRVMRRESKRLGLKIPLKLKIADLEVNTKGACREAFGIIEINKGILMGRWPDGVELACTVAHEVHHVKLFESVFFANWETLARMTPEERKRIARIRHEFMHYKSYRKYGVKAYESQLIEREARSYESSRERFYRKHLRKIIAAYLRKQREQAKC